MWLSEVVKSLKIAERFLHYDLRDINIANYLLNVCQSVSSLFGLNVSINSISGWTLRITLDFNQLFFFVRKSHFNQTIIFNRRNIFD